jgi:hypothetical protein
MSKFCYWTISWGDYNFMSQSLVNSARDVGIKEDFIVFSNGQLTNCINKELDSNIQLDLSNYMFKFLYLHKLKDYNYDYFVFIDSDSYFVRPPSISPLLFMQDNNPWHCFLESPINAENTNRPDWWGVPVQTLTNMFRNLGVINKEIRNMNAGYWICKKEFIAEACYLGIECYKYFVSNGFRITEEIPMAYISNYISTNPFFHYHEKHINYWASDWIGIFKDIIPFDKPWEYISYMTNERFMVQPALVHAMRSKNALIQKSKNQ